MKCTRHRKQGVGRLAAALIFAIFGGLFGCKPADRNRLIDVNIEGIKMKMPRYFLYTSSPYGISSIISIELLFSVIDRGKLKRFNDNYTLQQKNVFLLVDREKPKSLWAAYDVYVNNAKYTKYIGQKFYDNKLKLTCAEASRFGEYLLVCGKNSLNWPSETFIQCKRINIDKKPYCDQWFVHSGLSFEVSYPYTHLKDWGSIKQKIEQIFDIFLEMAKEKIDVAPTTNARTY